MNQHVGNAMRVLITVPSLAMPGGVANYYRTLRPYLDEQKLYFEIGARPGEVGRGRKMWRLLADAWKFHRLLVGHKFDLVHINPSMDLRSLLRDGVLLLIARLHNKRVLVFYHGWFPHVAEHVKRQYSLLFRFVFGQARANIVLAKEFQQMLAEMGVAPRTFLETTVVDDAVFSHVAESRAAESVPIEGGQKCRVLFLARLDTGKGLLEAIETFARLQEKYASVSLTVAGDGPERAAAEEDVRRRGLHDTRFTGHVDGMAKVEVFQNADIYLFLSQAEGMPTSLLEAMAFGLPIVTRLVGGICDFFEDGRMGYATDSVESSDYAERLAYLVSDPVLRTNMGRYNRDYAKNRFAASVVAKRLVAIYAQTVSKRS
jgi:glycosyltransferase involved in cell wall biosynthesis